MAAKSLYPTLPSPSSIVLSSDEEDEYEEEQGEELNEEPLEEVGEAANQSNKMKSHSSQSLNDFENTYLKQKMRSSKPRPSAAVLTAPILRQFCFWVWSFVSQFRFIFAGLFLALVTVLILGEGPGEGEEILCDFVSCHVPI